MIESEVKMKRKGKVVKKSVIIRTSEILRYEDSAIFFANLEHDLQTYLRFVKISKCFELFVKANIEQRIESLR